MKIHRKLQEAETRLTVEKLLKGHNSGKNRSSMTSIKYDHLQVIRTIIGKFHQNPLKTVGGVAETRSCLRRTEGLTDGRTGGRTEGRTDEPKTIVPFDLRRGTIKDFIHSITATSYDKQYAGLCVIH